MTDKPFSVKKYSSLGLLPSWITPIFYSILFTVQIFLFAPGVCQGSEIIVRLSGKMDHPGDLLILGNTIELRKVCFLGVDAKGKIDKVFLELISKEGIPKGNYEVTSPFPSEYWPVKNLQKNGALRLKFISGPGLKILNSSNKNGIAIHGRDFFPLLDGIFKKKIMINFYNDLLFERLQNHWGTLRISNWDMGRLADSWKKMNRLPTQWRVKIVQARPEEIENLCKPPVTKRSLD